MLCILYHVMASLIAQLVKNPPAMQKTPFRFLGWEDPLADELATHSSVLAQKFHEHRSLVGTIHGV